MQMFRHTAKAIAELDKAIAAGVEEAEGESQVTQALRVARKALYGVLHDLS